MGKVNSRWEIPLSRCGAKSHPRPETRSDSLHLLTNARPRLLSPAWPHPDSLGEKCRFWISSATVICRKRWKIPPCWERGETTRRHQTGTPHHRRPPHPAPPPRANHGNSSCPREISASLCPSSSMARCLDPGWMQVPGHRRPSSRHQIDSLNGSENQRHGCDRASTRSPRRDVLLLCIMHRLDSPLGSGILALVSGLVSRRPPLQENLLLLSSRQHLNSRAPGNRHRNDHLCLDSRTRADQALRWRAPWCAQLSRRASLGA